MRNFVIISGCSGGGKSSLLDELKRRGHACVDEPGRRIVQDEHVRGGTALPWIDAEAFAHRAIDMSLADRAAASGLAGWVFFDRGLVDALSALAHITGDRSHLNLALDHRSHAQVFLTPPWPELYRVDLERRHDFTEACEEYVRLQADYSALGYQIVTLPRLAIGQRASYLLARLGPPPGISGALTA